MARPVLDVYKADNVVDINRLSLSEELRKSARFRGGEGDELYMGPGGEFLSYSCWGYDEVYDGLVRHLTGRVKPERFDVPCMGLTDVDIFEVLAEILKRSEIAPTPFDYEELKKDDPEAALKVLKSPDYPNVSFDLYTFTNLPEDRDAEIKRLEEQLRQAEGKKGGKRK